MENLPEKEFIAVKQLNGEYRQNYFEEKVKQQQGFYLLINDEGPIMLSDPEQSDDGEANVLPVWSHPKYIDLFLENYKEVSGKSQFVTLAAWNQNWVKTLASEQVMLGYMPLDEQDFVVEPIKAFG